MENLRNPKIRGKSELHFKMSAMVQLPLNLYIIMKKVHAIFHGSMYIVMCWLSSLQDYRFTKLLGVVNGYTQRLLSKMQEHQCG